MSLMALSRLSGRRQQKMLARRSGADSVKVLPSNVYTPFRGLLSSRIASMVSVISLTFPFSLFLTVLFTSFLATGRVIRHILPPQPIV